MARQPQRAALVTGGTRGIGLQVARRLAADGFDLTLSARNPSGLAVAAAELGATTARTVQAVPADMADLAQVRCLADAHRSRFERLDLLVLAAGVGISKPFSETEHRSFDLMLDVNVRGPLALIQETLPLLRATAASEPARGARVVAVASLAGVVSEPGLAAYGATKAALISLCESLSLEESTHGISATAISPGYVDTDMTVWKRDELDPADMLLPSDIAELVLALTRMSTVAAVPNLVLTRACDRIWRA